MKKNPPDTPARIIDVSWEDFLALPIEEKSRLVTKRDGLPFHTLFAQQFDRAALDALCELASEIRAIAKGRAGMDFLQGLLSHKRAMLYFSQPS